MITKLFRTWWLESQQAQVREAIEKEKGNLPEICCFNCFEQVQEIQARIRSLERKSDRIAAKLNKIRH